MIPILYESTETEFASNGLGRLRDCISCIVTEERNGVYECDFEYPVDGHNYNLIQLGRIIACEHDDSSDIQPFDIVSCTRPLNGVVSFHAVHISYRQSKMVASGTNINSLSDAFSMLSNAVPSNPFSYVTDQNNATGYMAAADGKPKTVRQMLGGVEGSILDTYRGEFKWDKWQVSLLSSRGVARDFTIRYGVDLTEYNEDVDYSESYSSAVPFWSGADAVVTGDKQTVSGATYTGREECVPLDLSDKFETQPTRSELNDYALNYITSSNCTLPKQSITVSFVRLGDTVNYSALADLYKCQLCDTIKVDFPRYHMKGTFKIVKTVYDVLLERFTEMELGTLSTSLSEALGISESSSSVGDVSVDHILSRGTVGKWTYEKYKSGVLRAWYDSEATTVTLTTSSGNGWYRNPNAYTISIPSEIGCTGIKYANIVTMTDLANMITSIVGASTTTLSYYVSHLGTISSYSARVRAEIIGTWT